MKLHRIALRNLGPLYGEHEVDFVRALEDAPMFLISGLTGSGKSTLLDALCLALFGQTPRLRRSGRDEATRLYADDARRLMSEGTDDASAELEWSHVVRGTRVHHRAGWRCQRHRSGSLSRFMPPRRTLEVLEPEGWRTLVESSRPGELRPAFEEALGGFSLDSFLRSVLLAQGEFAAFLAAPDRERAEILARLTGTERYDRIGRRVTEEWEAVEDELESVHAEAEAAGLLHEDADLEHDLARLEAEVRDAREALGEVDRRLAWTARYLEAGAARAEAEAKLASLGADPGIEALEARERLAHLLPVLEELRAAESWLATFDEAETRARLVDETARAREVGARRAAAEAEVEALEGSIAELGARLEAERGRERVVRTLDLERAALARVDADLARWARHDDRALAAAAELGEALDAARALELEAAAARARTAERQDEDAKPASRTAGARASEPEDGAAGEAADAGGAEAALDADPDRVAEALSAEIERLAPAGPEPLWRATAAALAAVKRAEDIVRTLERARASESRRAEARERLAELSRELEQLEADRARAEAARAALADRIATARREAELEALRGALEPGAPCPVCGSREHPGVEPGPRPEDPSAELERLGRERRRGERERERLVRAIAVAEREAAPDPELERREPDVSRSEADLEHARLELERREEAARDLEARSNAVAELLARREDAIRAREESRRRRDADERARAEAAARAARARELDEESRRAWEAIRLRLADLGERRSTPGDVVETASPGDGERTPEALEALEAAAVALIADARDFAPAARDAMTEERAARDAGVAALEAERAALDARVLPLDARVLPLAGRSPAAELLAAERDLEAARRASADAAAETRHAEEEQARAAARLAEHADLLAKRETARAALGPAGASKLEALTPDEIARLRARRATDSRERTVLTSALELAERKLGELEETRPDPPLEQGALEAERDALTEQLGRAMFSLGERRAERDRALLPENIELKARLDELERQAHLHRRLHALVGRGDELKLFAQSLNLESLLEAANVHLSWVAPRYLLVSGRDLAGESRLSFTVRDRDLGDVERAVSTLSRGESFLVALALALALAGFEASERKVETLLVDHGFGSLDAESLDRALALVERLRPAGVQVGLIGHVPELETRIAAKIHIEPIGGGRSRVLTRGSRPERDDHGTITRDDHPG